MSKISKLTIAAVAAVTLLAGALATGPAEAKRLRLGTGLAILGTSIVVGSAIAAAREDDLYRRCHWVERYNPETDEYEDVKVCRVPY